MNSNWNQFIKELNSYLFKEKVNLKGSLQNGCTFTFLYESINPLLKKTHTHNLIDYVRVVLFSLTFKIIMILIIIKIFHMHDILFRNDGPNQHMNFIIVVSFICHIIRPFFSTSAPTNIQKIYRISSDLHSSWIDLII